MKLKLANHSSYPRIGDAPEGQLLRRANAQRQKEDFDLFEAGTRALTVLIAKEASPKTLAMGLLDGRNTRLESADETARQIEQIRAGSAYLTPACGLKYLPRDRAQLKLKHLTRVKNTFPGKTA